MIDASHCTLADSGKQHIPPHTMLIHFQIGKAGLSYDFGKLAQYIHK